MAMVFLSKLHQLADVVIDEAKTNKEFAGKLEAVLSDKDSTTEQEASSKKAGGKRASNRRDAAVLDPISLISEGESILSERLHPLTIKELKDIIAEYGMDPSKLAMKWKDKERLINHIIDTSKRRASKGDAFRDN